MNTARRNKPKTKDWRKLSTFIIREVHGAKQVNNAIFRKTEEAIGDTIELQNFDIWDGIFDEIVD